MKLELKKTAFIAICLIISCAAFNTKALAQETTVQETLKKGDKVPDFTLQDQSGNVFQLSDYIGKQKLVIFFYPKDESAICTTEACAFRDSYEKFNAAHAKVIGINKGTVESHKAFADKDHLPFSLLSDPDNKVLNLFGVKEQDFGNNRKASGRETFIIGLDGTVVYSFRDFMKGDEHSKQVLNYLDSK